MRPRLVVIVGLVLCFAASGVFAGGYFTTIGGNPKNYLAGFGSTVPVELSSFTTE